MLDYAFEYQEQNKHHEEEDLKKGFEGMRLSSQKQNSCSKYQRSSQREISESFRCSPKRVLPPKSRKGRRSPMRIQYAAKHQNERQREKRSKYQIKYQVLKRWGTLFKQLFKAYHPSSVSQQQTSRINEFSLSLGNSLPAIRKLLGFEAIYGKASLKRKYEQTANCERIRQFLLSFVDSIKVHSLINYSKLCASYKLELIQTVIVIRDLLSDPTIELVLL